ncbi:MAG: cysteine desulfurase family protein, partial [Acidimicrobiales bacterium]
MLAYLDHAASGPLHPAAVAAMRPWLEGRFGNPSGSHRVARAARASIDDARDALAAFAGTEPGEVTFTSGGTESDNLAVLGVLAARPGAAVVSAVEHPAVMEAAIVSGQEVRVAPVGADGTVDLDGLARLLDREVSLVSVQLANHETGVVQPFAAVERLVRRRAPRAVLHTDAVQAGAWLDLGDEAAGADLLTVSGHKLGGPQGVGALLARGRPALRSVLHGGGQERELRSGTQNVAGIAGLGGAVVAVGRERHAAGARVLDLRDELARLLLRAIPDCVETAAGARRVPGHLHLRFAVFYRESLLV